AGVAAHDDPAAAAAREQGRVRRQLLPLRNQHVLARGLEPTLGGLDALALPDALPTDLVVPGLAREKERQLAHRTALTRLALVRLLRRRRRLRRRRFLGCRR